jgi:hypothetical protein
MCDMSSGENLDGAFDYILDALKEVGTCDGTERLRAYVRARRQVDRMRNDATRIHFRNELDNIVGHDWLRENDRSIRSLLS